MFPRVGFFFTHGWMITMTKQDSSPKKKKVALMKSEGSQDRSSNPYQVGATTLIFIVNRRYTVSAFAMRSMIPGKMAVPPDSTTLAKNSLRMSTSCRGSAGYWPMKLGWNNTSTLRKFSA